jgi:hypothetical protein
MVAVRSAPGFVVHTPWGPRKSGMPLSVEMPAPVRATMRRAAATQLRTSAIRSSSMAPGSRHGGLDDVARVGKNETARESTHFPLHHESLCRSLEAFLGTGLLLPAPTPPESPPTTLTVRPWPDGVIDALGHDPRSAYVEQFWLGILGPSTTR